MVDELTKWLKGFLFSLLLQESSNPRKLRKRYFLRKWFLFSLLFSKESLNNMVILAESQQHSEFFVFSSLQESLNFNLSRCRCHILLHVFVFSSSQEPQNRKSSIRRFYDLHGGLFVFSSFKESQNQSCVKRYF